MARVRAQGQRVELARRRPATAGTGITCVMDVSVAAPMVTPQTHKGRAIIQSVQTLQGTQEYILPIGRVLYT